MATAAGVLIDPPGRAEPIGTHLRWWRNHRHFSQLDLAGRAEVSTRHLSFVETGRSHPSREMVLHLAEELDVPLRRRNELLLSAGYAPEFHEAETPAGHALEVLDRLLVAHLPAPAVVIDRHWNVVTMNAAAGFFADLVDPSLLTEPLNVLRLTLHPDGLLGRVVAPGRLATHLFHQVRRQAETAADPVLAALVDELETTIGDLIARTPTPLHPDTPVIEVELDLDGQRLRFITTMTTFGTPLEVGASELALETFHPVDEVTRQFLHARFRG